MVDLTKKGWQWTLLMALAFIWGSSFILMKRGLETFSNYQVAGMRMFISFLVLLPIIIKSINKLNKQNLKSILLVAFIGNGFPALLYTTSQLHLDSSMAGMLNSLTPIFTLIIGVVFYKSKVKFINIIGLFIGLIGAIGLFSSDISNFFSGNNWYALFAALATVFYGININEVKAKLQDLDGITITALAFLFVGPVSGIFLAFTDFSTPLQDPDFVQNLFYVALLAVFSSALAVIGINILIKYTTPIFTSSVTYIIPIFAIMWGFLDGEDLHIIELFSIIIVLLGIYLVNYKSKPKA
ncbi:MAG: EamA family transporter [Marinilabiliales bacterium]|nr:MAG: EamA family transporter [Marinilabiliales bacterium]